MKASVALKRKRWAHVCVYGEAGTGKSTLVSKLAEKHRLIWLALDGQGYSVIEKLPSGWIDNIRISVIPDTSDRPLAQDAVRKLIKGDAYDICDEHGAVSCSVCRKNGASFEHYHFNNNDINTVVVIDHLTRVTNSYLNQICKGKSEDYKPQRDDWGSLSKNVQALMADVQAARYNVCCLAQAMKAEEEDKTSRMMPSVGSYEFGRMVNQFFDDIIFCEMGIVGGKIGHKFGSSTTYSSSALSKSRRDIKIEDMPVPSLLPFFDKDNMPQEEGQAGEEAAKSLIEYQKKANSEFLPTEEEIANIPISPSPEISIADRLAALSKGRG